MSGEEQTNEGTATIAANGRVDRNVRELVRASITLDADDAAFLHSVIRDTGDGGPLWGRPVADEIDCVGDKHRAAWLRLYMMLGRACDMHGMPSNV